MPSLTPLVKKLLILWGALWVLSFLSDLADKGLSGYLQMDPSIFRGEWWRIPGVVTYALVHDPRGILHVGFNAYLMAVFGPEVEVLYPKRKFLRFLLVITLAGAAIHLSFALTGSPWFRAPVVGGSGLVMAVMAVNAAVYPDRILNLIILRCRMITFFLFLVGLDLLGFIAITAGRGGPTAADVHLAGAAVGWFWAGGFERFDNPLSRWRARRRQKSAQSMARRKQSEEAELDRILAKINQDGMNALTKAERNFLTQRSKK